MQAEFLTRITSRGGGVALTNHKDARPSNAIFAERVLRKVTLLLADRCHRQITQEANDRESR